MALRKLMKMVLSTGSDTLLEKVHEIFTSTKNDKQKGEELKKLIDKDTSFNDIFKITSNKLFPEDLIERNQNVIKELVILMKNEEKDNYEIKNIVDKQEKI